MKLVARAANHDHDSQSTQPRRDIAPQSSHATQLETVPALLVASTNNSDALVAPDSWADWQLSSPPHGVGLAWTPDDNQPTSLAAAFRQVGAALMSDRRFHAFTALRGCASNCTCALCMGIAQGAPQH